MSRDGMPFPQPHRNFTPGLNNGAGVVATNATAFVVETYMLTTGGSNQPIESQLGAMRGIPDGGIDLDQDVVISHLFWVDDLECRHDIW